MGRPALSTVELSPTTKDITGQRFGKLQVISFSHYEKKGNNKGRYAKWHVKCDCGTEKVMFGTVLTKPSARTPKSCGCLRSEAMTGRTILRMPDNHAEKTVVMTAYKKRAAKKGIPFRMARETFVELIQQDCHYCGSPPSNSQQHNKYQGRYEPFLYNGLDRIDSNKGYTKNNVVPCCKRCNQAKNDLTVQDFLDHVQRICTHMKGKK